MQDFRDYCDRRDACGTSKLRRYELRPVVHALGLLRRSRRLNTGHNLHESQRYHGNFERLQSPPLDGWRRWVGGCGELFALRYSSVPHEPLTQVLHQILDLVPRNLLRLGDHSSHVRTRCLEKRKHLVARPMLKQRAHASHESAEARLELCVLAAEARILFDKLNSTVAFRARGSHRLRRVGSAGSSSWSELASASFRTGSSEPARTSGWHSARSQTTFHAGHFPFVEPVHATRVTLRKQLFAFEAADRRDRAAEFLGDTGAGEHWRGLHWV